VVESATLPRRIIVRVLAGLVTVTAVVLGAVPAPAALAGTHATSTFTARLTPANAPVRRRTPFAVTVTNAATSVHRIGSVQLVVPKSFADVSVSGLPPGWVRASGVRCSKDSPAGCAGNTLVQVGTAGAGARRLRPGRSLTFTVDATPTVLGETRWNLAAKSSCSWRNGTVFTPPSPMPAVTVVAGVATSVTIDSVADEQGNGLRTGKRFDVTLTSRDRFGHPSTDYSAPLPLSLTASGGDGSPGTLKIPGSPVLDGSSATVHVTGLRYSGSATDITLRAAAPGLSPGTATIDVFQFALTVPATPGAAVSVEDCPGATDTQPVCGSLVLSHGAKGPVVVGQSVCPFGAGSPSSCLSTGENQAVLVTGVANLTDAAGHPLYSRSDPAVLQLECAKSLCRGDWDGDGPADSDDPTFPIHFEPSGATSYTTAPPCPAAGVIGPGQSFCRDYARDFREGDGTLHAFVNFLLDARGIF